MFCINCPYYTDITFIYLVFFDFIEKFVVSRCAFAKLRRISWFFCSVNHISGPVRKHMFTSTSSNGHVL